MMLILLIFNMPKLRQLLSNNFFDLILYGILRALPRQPYPHVQSNSMTRTTFFNYYSILQTTTIIFLSLTSSSVFPPPPQLTHCLFVLLPFVLPVNLTTIYLNIPHFSLKAYGSLIFS